MEWSWNFRISITIAGSVCNIFYFSSEEDSMFLFSASFEQQKFYFWVFFLLRICMDNEKHTMHHWTESMKRKMLRFHHENGELINCALKIEWFFLVYILQHILKCTDFSPVKRDLSIENSKRCASGMLWMHHIAHTILFYGIIEKRTFQKHMCSWNWNMR